MVDIKPYDAGTFVANNKDSSRPGGARRTPSQMMFKDISQPKLPNAAVVKSNDTSDDDYNPFDTASTAASSSSLDSQRLAIAASAGGPGARTPTSLDGHEAGSSRPSPLIMLLTFLASISGFMMGYDTGYISSALVVIGQDLGHTLTNGDKEFITSATSLGALIAALFSGMAADVFGRKKIICFSNVLFICGAAVQCGAHDLWPMIIGRFIMGLGVGIGSLIAPLYISELAPTRFRGRLVVINCLAITGGQLIAYAIGAGLSNVNNGWRILVGISIIPSSVQLIVFTMMPDTPRYLIMKNKLTEAANVLQKIYKNSNPELINAKVEELYEINGEVSGSNCFVKTFNCIKEIHLTPSNLRALIIACGLQGIQQFTGWNALMYFSATIFESIGFNNSTAVSLIIAGTNFLFTCVAFFVIDRVGRRRILLIGLPMMVVSLTLCAISFHYLGLTFEDGEAVLPDNDGKVSVWGILIIIGMVWFASSFSIGIGNVPWQQSELFPQKVRGIGASYSTATCWTGALVISSTFLTMMENITPMGTFILFAALSFFAVIAVYFCYPELTGLELEEVQTVLTGGFNIRKSLELSKERRKGPHQDMGALHLRNTISSDAFDSKPSVQHIV